MPAVWPFGPEIAARRGLKVHEAVASIASIDASILSFENVSRGETVRDPAHRRQLARPYRPYRSVEQRRGHKYCVLHQKQYCGERGLFPVLTGTRSQTSRRWGFLKRRSSSVIAPL